jgi:hypothetical protein
MAVAFGVENALFRENPRRNETKLNLSPTLSPEEKASAVGFNLGTT